MSSLIRWSRIPRKSLYNWALAPDDPQYRTMPPVAKRLLALLGYFALTGQLTKERLADIEALEAAMEDENTFNETARRVSRILGIAKERSAERTGLEMGPHNSEHDIR
jgi:hypothetical protein